MAGQVSRLELALDRDQTTAFRDQEVVTITEVDSSIKSLFHLLGLVPEDTILPSDFKRLLSWLLPTLQVCVL